MQSRQAGKQGEELGVRYLLKWGYRIVKRNVYSRWGEIDIIAWDKAGPELVFVEVKLRGSGAYGRPEEAVDEIKLARIIDTAEEYLDKVGYQGKYRYDCLAIEVDSWRRVARIKHLKNIS